jgi:hypothetical protein
MKKIVLNILTVIGQLLVMYAVGNLKIILVSKPKKNIFSRSVPELSPIGEDPS